MQSCRCSIPQVSTDVPPWVLSLHDQKTLVTDICCTMGITSSEFSFGETYLIIRVLRHGWALVAHACNPSYLGGRDQEDHGSRLAQANSLCDAILKIPNTKMG
jgi:hypothetical protein